MKRKMPVIILLLAPYVYWGLGAYFLTTRGGLSEKALIPILCMFGVFVLLIEIPCLICIFRQGQKGFSAGKMLAAGCILFAAMIPIWIVGILVSAAMASTILLSVLIPVLLLIDGIFTIPALLLLCAGMIRHIIQKEKNI